MNYDEFTKHMEDRFPGMFRGTRYGGFAVGAGWYQILESLCANIQHHVKWVRDRRARELRIERARSKGLDAVIKLLSRGKEPSVWELERADEIMERDPGIATEYVHKVRVDQVKEKFGGLRFYYTGGDDVVSGMVSMAESWAAHTCEECGQKGKQREGGWIRTLCDEHEAEYQKKQKQRGY